VQKKRVLLRPAVEKRAQDLAQARADYRVFSNSVEEAVMRDVDAIFDRLFSR
jgi:hypothetical protein